MLTKTNICSVQNYLRGTLIVSNVKMINKMLTLPPGKISADAMNDRAFSLSFFSLLSCFHASRIVCFFPFS